MVTDAFEIAQKHCAEVLKTTYDKYVASLKKRISGLSKCDKRWWRLNRQLLSRRVRNGLVSVLCTHPLKHISCYFLL